MGVSKIMESLFFFSSLFKLCFFFSKFYSRKKKKTEKRGKLCFFENTHTRVCVCVHVHFPDCLCLLEMPLYKKKLNLPHVKTGLNYGPCGLHQIHFGQP